MVATVSGASGAKADGGRIAAEAGSRAGIAAAAKPQCGMVGCALPSSSWPDGAARSAIAALIVAIFA
jgi:hypothetical protein